MHDAFDEWLRRNFADVQFARYADDAVVHARSLAEAGKLLTAIRSRLAGCGLELHPEKTKIVYCKDDDRRGTHEHTSFDFLGYTFRPRRVKNRWGKLFISFLPGVSNQAANAIRETIRSWRIGATRNNQTLVQTWVADASLTLHSTKTRIVDSRVESFAFPGFEFRGEKHWPRKKSIQKLKDSLRSKTKRTSGDSLQCVIVQLNQTLRGWFGYFRHSSSLLWVAGEACAKFNGGLNLL